MEYEWNLLTALSFNNPSKLFYNVIQKNPYPINLKIIFRHLIDNDYIPLKKIYERLSLLNVKINNKLVAELIADIDISSVNSIRILNVIHNMYYINKKTTYTLETLGHIIKISGNNEIIYNTLKTKNERIYFKYWLKVFVINNEKIEKKYLE